MNQFKEKIMADYRLLKLLITVTITLSVCTSLCLFVASWPLMWHWSIKIFLFGITATAIVVPMAMEDDIRNTLKDIKSKGRQ